jgi:[protein-PII] uridylyltransferase
MAERPSPLSDPHLTGTALCRALSDRMDAWLAHLFTSEVGQVEGVALVAVGGYGRGELSPQSDIDLLLLHEPRRGLDQAAIAGIADRIWYPIWDEGLKLGHAVRTEREALALAADDLDTATSLLTVRRVAGDAALVDHLADEALARWRKRARHWLERLSESVKQRHRRAGETAFLLEPDLKDGRGGLRDVHAIRWAEAARSVMLEGDVDALREAYETILSARVELHRLTGRPNDRLVLEQQDAVADALGYGDADDLMRALSTAARSISWTSDELWDRVDGSLEGPRRLRSQRERDLGDGVVLRDGVVAVRASVDPATDPLLVLRVAAAAARHTTRIDRQTLWRLAAEAPPLPDPWPDGARQLLVDLLAAGRPAIGVVEALDQTGSWAGVLPEWDAVRCKPQRNAYHTFTVDRHLCEAAANAAGLVDRVDRADLLLVGTLLHDIGKGFPGDHTEVGIDLLERLGPRLGFSAADTEVLVQMVRHHLLLPDVAVRRDLADPGTLRLVVDEVGTVTVLRLLGALTEADSRATGPAAWNAWKAELVSELVDRTAHVLEGGAIEEVAIGRRPQAERLAQVVADERLIEGDGDQLLVAVPDRPGLFSRVAGALSLCGLDVLEATAHTDDRGMALETFRVQNAFGGAIDWERVTATIGKLLDGRLALEARLAERARSYARPPAPGVAPRAPAVLVDNQVSARATVVEVRAPDGIGLLYRITRAIGELDLDLRVAKVQTLTDEVVDSFYVCDGDGRKVTDDERLAELERAVLHVLR